jgi:3-oxoacyl-[acyl-carrier protein] reductase
MDFGLRGKRALMLAASTGLGRASAESLAAEGANLVISSSNQGRCDAAASEIAAAHGVKAVGIAADLFQPAQMDALFDNAAKALGGIDILFINNGGPALGLAKDIDADSLQPQFNMAVESPIRLIKRALPGMRAQRWGRIVTAGGASMVQALPNKVMDNTMRPAMVGYSKALSNEVAVDGITVNCIVPGTFVTERVHNSTASNAALLGISPDEMMQRRLEGIPAGRFGDLREFGDLIAFLCSDRAGYINGSVIRIDGSQVKGNS